MNNLQKICDNIAICKSKFITQKLQKGVDKTCGWNILHGNPCLSASCSWLNKSGANPLTTACVTYSWRFIPLILFDFQCFSPLYHISYHWILLWFNKKIGENSFYIEKYPQISLLHLTCVVFRFIRFQQHDIS